MKTYLTSYYVTISVIKRTWAIWAVCPPISPLCHNPKGRSVLIAWYFSSLFPLRFPRTSCAVTDPGNFPRLGNLRPLTSNLFPSKFWCFSIGCTHPELLSALGFSFARDYKRREHFVDTYQEIDLP